MGLEVNQEYAALWKEHGIEKVRKTRTKAPTSKKKTAPPSLSSLQDVQDWLGNCKRCGLCKDRNKIVFGVGNPKAKLMFVGEGPGADEDAQGLPFVGRAGQLLNKVIEAMGKTREEVYIANIVKCRPPGNRVPEPGEIAQCLPFLKAQIDQIQPEMIVGLGLTAGRALLQTEETMGNIRGKFQSLAWNSNIPVLPTYHPAYLLRNPSAKKIVWDDMKLVMKRMKK